MKNIFLILACILFFNSSYSQTNPTDDFDGDGIINSIDIDDDNDGILDVIECNQGPLPVYYDGLNGTSGNTIVSLASNSQNPPTSHGIAWSEDATGGSTHDYLKTNTTITQAPDPSFVISPSPDGGEVVGVASANYLGTSVTENIVTSYNVSVGQQYWIRFWYNSSEATNPSISTDGVANIKLNLNNGLGIINKSITVTPGYNDFSQWKSVVLGPYTSPTTTLQIRIEVEASTSNSSQIRYIYTAFDGIELFNTMPTPLTLPLVDCDYDNDLIQNQFDLDSDKDGCSDAYEGGSTNNTATNYQFPTTNIGANGLDNNLETAVDNGIINYSLTYSKAIDSTDKSCIVAVPGIDTDNDGIADNVDIDDDNDGIRDGDECSDSTLITDPNNVSNVYDPGIWTDLGFHQFVMKLNNKWYITGEDMDPLGTNDVLTPIEISSANGYIFSGNIIKASAGKDMVAILTDANNIYIWGSAKPNLLLTPGANFSSIINALPLGYNSQNVKKIKLAQVTMYLLMDDGTVWIRGNTSLVCYGAGTGNCVTDNWSQMKTDATTPLTNIKYMDAWESNGIAYANDGKYYAWGKNTYLGLGASSSDNKYATLLNEFPVGTPKEIQLGEDGSYYVHMQDSTISVMGDNLIGELGINTTINKLTWGKMLNTAGTSPIKVIMFSGNDYGNRCSMIDENKDFLILGDAFGDGSTYNLLGTGSFSSSIVKLPIKPVPSTLPKAIWTSMGGHLVHFVGVDGKFYNTGHNRGGGFGDGTTLSRKDFQGYPLPGLNLTNIQEPDKCDYDKDSILNFLDLDSDGDGCSDAFEGGSTTDKTTNYAFTGTMGTNGLDNSLETSVDNGIINYTLTYSKAIDSTDKWCNDTDNDGIADKYDIDDDNDGIRDGDECSDSTLIIDPSGASSEYNPGIFTDAGSEHYIMKYKNKWYIAGYLAGATNANMNLLKEINATNGFNFIGNIVNGTADDRHYAILTDQNNIYINSYTANTLNDNTVNFALLSNSLPTGYTYVNVVTFRLSLNVFLLHMTDGTVWLRGDLEGCYGSGGNCVAGIWKQVKINTSTPLTNVKYVDVNNSNGLAYTNDGKYYGWAKLAFFPGGGSPSVNEVSYATLLNEFPIGTPKQIQVGAYAAYYVLMNDGTISVMGYNVNGQLGLNTITNQLSWAKMLNSTASAPIKVKMFSANEYDQAVILIDEFQKLHVLGQSRGSSTGGGYNVLGLGGSSTTYRLIPFRPLPLTLPDPIWVQVGGFFSHYIANDGKLYSSGLALNGAFGDGNLGNRMQYVGNTVSGIDLTNIQAPSACDYDGDGILDFLDLDSDGDGCSDAFEGGSTTDKTSNYAFAGTMGTNGLDNSLETAVDNGIINYTITYDSIALDSNIHTCTKIPTVLDTINEDSFISFCDTTITGNIADSLKIFSQSKQGLVTIEAKCFKYTPNINYVGLDSMIVIYYKGGSPDTVTIITLVSTKIDTFGVKITNQNQTLLNLCDSSFITVNSDSTKLCNGGKNGTSTINGKCVDYTPKTNYIGKDTLCIINCNDGVCDTAIQPIIVNSKIDTLPVDTIPEGGLLVKCDSSLIGSNADSVKICDGGENGTSTITGKCVNYTPNPNYIGRDTLCIIVCNDGVCDTSIQPILVGPGITDTLPVDTIPEGGTLVKCDSSLIGSNADSVKMCDGGENGTSTITGKCVNYTPNPNYVGRDTLCIIVCNDGVCDTTIQPILVGPGITDTLPVDTIPEGGTLVKCDSSLIGSNSDSVKMCDGGENGTSTITGKCVNYTPNPNYIGRDTLCIIVCNDGVCDTSIQPILVGPGITDTLPVDTIPEGGLLVKCDSSLIGSNADSVKICDGGENGTSTITGKCVNYTPNPNYIGRDTLCIIVCNDGVCDTSIQPILVGPGITDTLPVDTIPEGGTLVKCDSSLIGSNADSVKMCDGGENGTSTITGKCVNYTPNPNYVGRDTLCIIVCNDGVCDTTIQPILVGPGITDTLPVDTIPEGGTLVKCDSSLIGSNSDSVKMCDGGENGTSTITGKCVNYTPNPNYIGRDTLCIIVCNDGVCDTSIQPILVGPGITDTLPVDTIPEGGTLVKCDSSLIGSNVDSVKICDGGENGTSTITGKCVNYTPNPNYIGRDTLCIIVCNDGICDTSIQPILVGPGITDTLPVDTIPEGGLLVKCDSSLIGSSADSVKMCDGGENGTSTITGKCVNYTPNPNYIGRDTLCIIVCNDGVCDTSIQPILVGPGITDTLPVDTIPEGGTLVKCDSSLIGSNADSVKMCDGGENGTSTITGKCVNYTPNPNYVGRDTLCIIVCNDGICDTSIQPILVGPGITDTLPVDTIPEGGLLVKCDSSLIGSNADSVKICDGGENGTSTITGKCVNYTPNPNYIGRDTLCIIVCNDGVCDTSIQPILVGPGITDTLPVDTIPEGGTLVKCDSSLIGSNADSVKMCDGGENGTSTITGKCVNYTPNPNYIGRDTLCIIVCNDGVCDTSIQPILVGPGITDTLPVDTIPEGGTLVKCDSSLIGSNADSVKMCDGGENGTSTITGKCVNYTPNPNYIGRDTLCIIVCNDGVCDTSIQPIIIIPIKDTLPVDTIPEGGILVKCDSSLIGSSADSVKVCDGGKNGTSTITGKCVNYTPNPNYIGRDTICIIVCNDGICDTSIQPIIVIPVKDTLPVDTIPEGSTLVKCDSSLIGSSADSVKMCDGGKNGTSTITGKCVNYTPNPNYIGRDTICIIVCNDGICDTIIQPIIVIPIKDTLPVDTIPEGSTLVKCDSSLIGSSADSVKMCDGGKNGTSTITGKCVNYTPNPNYIGRDTICIIVCNDGICDTSIQPILVTIAKTVDTITVTPICPTCSTKVCPPTNEVIATGSTTSIINPPSGYTVVGPDKDGCYSFVPNGKVTDTTTTKIVICDTTGRCDTSVLIIYPPVPKKDTIVITTPCSDCPVLVCPIMNDVKKDGAKYSLCDTTNSIYKVIGPDSNGCFTFTSSTSEVKDTFETCIIICNGNRCDTTVVFLKKGKEFKPIVDNSIVEYGKDNIINVALNDSLLSGKNTFVSQNATRGDVFMDAKSGKTIYRPKDSLYRGIDSFEYTVKNQNGQERSTIVYVYIDKKTVLTYTLTTDTSNKTYIDSNGYGKGSNIRYQVVSGPSNGQVTLFDSTTGQFIYVSEDGKCGMDSVRVMAIITYQMSGKTNDTLYYNVLINVICKNLVFPTYISPNGDGINDEFDIKILMNTLYQGGKLTIYNRWGNIEWRSVGAYDGVSFKGQNYKGEDLMDGVYYYLLENEDDPNFENKTGFIEIMRN